MKKFQALLLVFTVSFTACAQLDEPLSSKDQASEVVAQNEYGSPETPDAGGSAQYPGDPGTPYPGDPGTPEPGDPGTPGDPGGMSPMEPEYGDVFDIDWKKTANCTANFTGLTGMAVAAVAAVALAGVVIAEIAGGAGAGTAIAAAWADVVAVVGSIQTAADVGAAIALLYERFATFQNVLTGIGTTAAALGITQAAKDSLDGALQILKDYATGWSNYKKCCIDNDASACGNMPFNVF